MLLTVKTRSRSTPKELSEAEQVLEAAVAQVAKRATLRSNDSSQINSYKSPGYPQVLVDLTITATRQGVAYLADEYEFTGADFVFFRREEADWAQTQWDQLVAGTTLSGVTVFDDSWRFPCGSAEYTYKKGGQTKYITYSCQDGNEFSDVSFAAHGAIHWFQGNFNAHTMPNWLNEGSATFYGEVIGWLPNQVNAKMIKWNNDVFLHNALLDGEESIRTRIRNIEIQNPPSTGDGYTLGRMLYTAWIGLHGEEKALHLMKSFGSSSDFAGNFQLVYGFSKEAFYDEAIPLIAEWADRDWGQKYSGKIWAAD